MYRLERHTCVRLSIHVAFFFQLIPMLHNFKREAHREILNRLSEIAEAGALKPVPDETNFTLDQVGDAHARLESKSAIGKVVVEN